MTRERWPRVTIESAHSSKHAGQRSVVSARKPDLRIGARSIIAFSRTQSVRRRALGMPYHPRRDVAYQGPYPELTILLVLMEPREPLFA